MGNRPIIEWCGPCWIDGERSLAVRKIRKLPLCTACSADFLGHDAEIDKVYAIWDAMPDMDNRPEAWEHFQRVLGWACNQPHRKKHGPITKEEDDKACLRKGKRTLEQIRALLRNPQSLREAGSRRAQTSQT